MHRNNILDLLFQYKIDFPKEKYIADKFIEFVNNNSDCFERTLQKGHLTGSALLLNKAKTDVLLTHHKKLNKWLQLGGHADGDTNILQVAGKEVKEESGLTDFELLFNGIFDLDAHLIPAWKNEAEHYHYDVRFLFLLTGSEKFTVSNESIDLKWIKLNEIENYTNEKSILRMIEKLSSGF